MDFEKKYHLTQAPGQHIFVTWTRGYREVEVYYHNKLIGSVENAAQLKKGVTFQVEDLGKVELVLSGKPITLNVIVEGYHARNNMNHPARELKGAANYFTVLAVFALLGGLLEGYRFSNYVDLVWIISGINVLVLATYIIAAVFVAKSKPWAFYLGIFVFSSFTVLTLYYQVILQFNIIYLIAFLVRLAFQYFLITNLKYAIETSKHNKFGNRTNDGLLDDFS